MRAVKVLAVVVFVIALGILPAFAQAPTASTAVVQGTVSDATGAVIPGAEVSLTDTATNISRTTTTNSSGFYVFSSVLPGVYRLAIKAEGFRQAILASLKVDVAKSHLVNVTLEVGAVAETVEVTAGAGVELQTSDATVGGVVGGEALLRMPLPDRSVANLLMVQPLTIPGKGVDNTAGGQVAGARSDQTTFLIDGGDASCNTEGTCGYNSGFVGTPRPMIPATADSIEEFRVTTATPNATFSRSQGGQVSLVTRRGSNEFHGSAYWYHQNDNLNANSWSNNRSGIRLPELKDNRYGFSAGGPIQKDTTWIFGNYEGRRFPQSSTISRLVPTSTLRAGILQFRDATGTVRQYDLATSTACGPTGTSACDPRGIGMSPVIAAMMALYPAGNAPGGDGLNTTGFRIPVPTDVLAENVVVRLDRKITDKWDFFASGRYYKFEQPGTQQVDIAGLTCGGASACAVRNNPLAPRYYVAGVNGQLTPALTSETRFSWSRHWWEWQTQAPFPQVPGTSIAVDMGTESVASALGTAGGVFADLVNIDTQQARSRVWNGKDSYIAQNLVWVRGKHTFQFGGSFRNQGILHQRTDKVTGGLTTAPILYVQDGTFIFPSPTASGQSPPTCAGAITTFCLVTAGERTAWNQLYTSVLGIVDRLAQIGVRDGSFNPLPLGTNVTADVTIRAYEVFFQDSWRIVPSLSLTIGLAYNLQMPPTEALGRQVLPVYVATGDAVRLDGYFAQRARAAASGQVFNPSIGYAPVSAVPGFANPTDPDTNNWAPRLAFAWNPSFNNPFFGDRKTVIRGGWTTTYTRMNGVGLVMTPVLGLGLAETVRCTGPRAPTGVCGGAGATATTAWRIGVDGSSLAFSPRPPAQIPFPIATPFGESQTAAIDPGMRLGLSHSADLTIQRELPGNMLIEVGWMGRVGRNLQHVVDLNAMPFFQLDPASGTTVAQAFDFVSQQIRAGVDPSLVTPHPWFENQFGAGGTVAIATGCPTEFEIGWLADSFLFCGDDLGPQEYNNRQVLIHSLTSDGGNSDYHAGFLSVRRRMSGGLMFDVNYTWSKSIDFQGLNQEYVFYSYMSVWNPYFDRGLSLWDRTHVVNATWFYELPFGRGRRFAVESGALDKVVGGWYVSGIFTGSSGLPICAFSGGNYGSFTAGNCARPVSSAGVSTGGNKLHPNVASGGVATAGAGAAGSGLNLFANPEGVFNGFRRPLISVDGRAGIEGLRGFPRWNVDLSLGKKTSITEKINLSFQLDFFNLLNRFEPGDPGVSLNDPAGFGVVTGQFNGTGLPNGGARAIQFGFRIDW